MTEDKRLEEEEEEEEEEVMMMVVVVETKFAKISESNTGKSVIAPYFTIHDINNFCYLLYMFSSV